MQNTKFSELRKYVAENAVVNWETEDIPQSPIVNQTEALQANINYYENPQWVQGYFDHLHRDDKFKECWQAATGSWDDKIVVDIGCGPGNLYATLGGKPRLLIGVDVSRTCLKMASSIGYTPMQADAHQLPFISEFADIVVANASLHHCDDMNVVLSEAARLVRPGGILITDHDPQQSAWNWKGLAMLLYKVRVPLYRIMYLGNFMSQEEHDAMIASETYHKPGKGVTSEFYYQTLEPLGFRVKVYPHNHTVGAEVLQGNYGKADIKYRFSQWLCGINSKSPKAALSLMCIAQRQD
ncbi:MAG: class I SAM-dependent methyltransferase [Cyanobacteria bacterium J06636_27]